MIPPIRKTLTVPATPDEAFRRFTAEMHTWWPLRSHSVFDERVQTCALEPFVGGRLYESSVDGEEAEWGEVTAWEPPARVAFTFMRYGDGPETHVEVRFDAVEGGTRVSLEHTGWDAWGAETRDGYDTGWDLVFTECYGATFAVAA